MSDRRSMLKGLATSPVALGIGLALPAALVQSSAVDPFPGYHRDTTALIEAMVGASDYEIDQLQARWIEIDELAEATRPTTLAGAVACLEWARREHAQFNMGVGKDDPGARLILSLLDGALSVLRQTQRQPNPAPTSTIT